MQTVVVSVSGELVIHRAPDRRWVPSGCLERCNPDTLCIPVFDASVQIEWYKNGLLIPGASGNNYIATEDGTYQAFLTDAFGCSTMSDPLTLQLYNGFGDIEVEVYRDVNENGIIDGPDTLVTYPQVLLDQQGLRKDTAYAAPDLLYYFVNEEADDYVLILDEASLLPGDDIIIGRDSVSIVGCDKKVRGQLLIRESCPADSSEYTYQFLFR